MARLREVAEQGRTRRARRRSRNARQVMRGVPIRVTAGVSPNVQIFRIASRCAAARRAASRANLAQTRRRSPTTSQTRAWFLRTLAPRVAGERSLCAVSALPPFRSTAPWLCGESTQSLRCASSTSPGASGPLVGVCPQTKHTAYQESLSSLGLAWRLWPQFAHSIKTGEPSVDSSTQPPRKNNIHDYPSSRPIRRADRGDENAARWQAIDLSAPGV